MTWYGDDFQQTETLCIGGFDPYPQPRGAEGGLSAWTELSPPPLEVPVLAAADGERLWVASADLVTGAVHGGGPAVGTWTSPSLLPAPAGGAALGVGFGRLWLVGGQHPDDEDLATTDVWSASIGSDASLGDWRAERPLPLPRRHASVAAAGARLVVLAGEIEEGTPGDLFWSAVVAEDGTLQPWEAGFSDVVPPAQPVGAVMGGQLWLLGNSVTASAPSYWPVITNVVFSAPIAGLPNPTWTPAPLRDWSSSRSVLLPVCDGLVEVLAWGRPQFQGMPFHPLEGAGPWRVPSPDIGTMGYENFAAASTPSGRLFVVDRAGLFTATRAP